MSKHGMAALVLQRLTPLYPGLRSALDWKNPWELLVATVLAAQCTDARVNTVTPGLFARWPGPAELALAAQEELEAVVRSTGFFRNKAKNLRGAAARVMEAFSGRVPRTMEQLLSLPGVARKTANIVLSGAFGVHEGIAVDTHVKRLAYRLGLTDATDPVVIERDLTPLFPRETWGAVNHLLVDHGRAVCTARKPQCPACVLADACPRRGVGKT
ncbi:MAG: endonuclease III [Desulfovibrionaceae bacterium]|nr:endonuclease III [Desulfovibrionaceae bacterium]MBF0512718.1 endonuclease III [Desulfovibrionaceae bacterium]